MPIFLWVLAFLPCHPTLDACLTNLRVNLMSLLNLPQTGVAHLPLMWT